MAVITNMRFVVIGRLGYLSAIEQRVSSPLALTGENIMKIWTKPAVRETEVGLEVTSYLPAEIDLI